MHRSKRRKACNKQTQANTAKPRQTHWHNGHHPTQAPKLTD
jgi:hypothetical protein